jgi:hypothetical protein
MYLDGLSPLQVQIAETLWTIGNSYDCKRWLDTLSPQMRDEALVVMDLMVLAAVDEEVEMMEYYPEAEAIIEQIRNNNR